MKERPILFSAPMVRAILDGSKTQTRRVIKGASGAPYTGALGPNISDCKHGKPGDQIWVRETFRLFDNSNECACFEYPCGCPPTGTPVYRADTLCNESKWKPSIFMPRWASRISLEITGIRVERLNDISDADAVAEGIECVGGGASCYPWKNYGQPQGAPQHMHCSSPVTSFVTLWTKINGPDSWKANPWVWVIEFKRING